MAKVGAQRAAELTGKSKSTIQRAMKSGKISYELDANSRRVVDVAELERAFGLIPQESETKQKEAAQVEIERATQMLEMERFKLRIKVLEEQLSVAQEQIEDLKGQRDQWQKQAQQVLITSQYSQKQAEQYKQELDERNERIRQKRQQELERRMKAMQAQSQNQNQAQSGQKRPAGQQSAAAKRRMHQKKLAQKPAAQQSGWGIDGILNKFLGDSNQPKKAAGGKS